MILQLEDLNIPTVISHVEEHEGITTLRRYDGVTVAFFSNNDSITQGDKGLTGPSAFEDYTAKGGTLTVEEWLNSFFHDKGPVGDKGDEGDIGITGDPGDNFSLARGYVRLTRSGKPTATLTRSSGNKYSLDIKVPTTTEIPVKMGTVTDLNSNQNPAGVLLKDYDNTIINLAIPKGPSSTVTVTPAKEDYPDINLNVSMKSYDSPLSVISDIKEDSWDLTLNIPRGLKGDIGDKGPVGFKTSSTITYNKIIEDEGLINAPEKNSFFPVRFVKDNVTCFGWSCRTQKTIFQTAFTTDGKVLSRTKTNGLVFGTVSSGWKEVTARYDQT